MCEQQTKYNCTCSTSWPPDSCTQWHQHYKRMVGHLYLVWKSLWCEFWKGLFKANSKALYDLHIAQNWRKKMWWVCRNKLHWPSRVKDFTIWAKFRHPLRSPHTPFAVTPCEWDHRDFEVSVGILIGLFWLHSDRMDFEFSNFYSIETVGILNFQLGFW